VLNATFNNISALVSICVQDQMIKSEVYMIQNVIPMNNEH